MKEAVFCPSPDCANFALEGLVRLVNLLCAGRAPPTILPFLCGASLLACNKKNGGLRPIAVGEVLRRLTSKCVSRAVQDDAIEILSPLQLGVGISVGCESIVHSVASLQEDSSVAPDSRCALLVDFSTRLLVSASSRKCGPGYPLWLPGLNASSTNFILRRAPNPQLLRCSARRSPRSPVFCPCTSSYCRTDTKGGPRSSYQRMVP